MVGKLGDPGVGPQTLLQVEPLHGHGLRAAQAAPAAGAFGPVDRLIGAQVAGSRDPEQGLEIQDGLFQGQPAFPGIETHLGQFLLVGGIREDFPQVRRPFIRDQRRQELPAGSPDEGLAEKAVEPRSWPLPIGSARYRSFQSPGHQALRIPTRLS